MIWSFLAVFFAGWLYIDASYRGPEWQRQLFKPITSLMLLGWAWQAQLRGLPDHLILAGLAAAAVGGTLSLFPKQNWLYAFGALFLSSLLYSLNLTRQITLGNQWPIALFLALMGVIILVLLWRYLAELRWPASLMLIMNLLLCWLATLHNLYAQSAGAFSFMTGADLLLLSNIVWLVSAFRRRFAADCAIYEGLFIIGHFMIARSLWLN
jgi:uncharacterized membrane protein YhhN